MATLIREHAPFVSVEICDVADIDAYVARSALNLLERERASLLIRRAPACTRIIADGRTLFGPLSTEFPRLEAVDRAESATSGAISMPRFIGPGCMTMVRVPRRARRVPSSP